MPDDGDSRERVEALREEHDVYLPSVDVCAFCTDSECDGIGCIAGLDANDESDHPAIERLHELLRCGRAWLAMCEVAEAIDDDTSRGRWLLAMVVADEALADAEHRESSHNPRLSPTLNGSSPPRPTGS